MLLLYLQRCFHHRRGQPGLKVPIDVTVKEPHPGIVSLEAQHDVPTRRHHDGVPPDGDAGELRRVTAVWAGVHPRASEDLERVAVEMKRMATVVEVVEDNVDNGIVGEDVSVGVDAVNNGVGGLGASTEGGI